LVNNLVKNSVINAGFFHFSYQRRRQQQLLLSTVATIYSIYLPTTNTTTSSALVTTYNKYCLTSNTTFIINGLKYIFPYHNTMTFYYQRFKNYIDNHTPDNISLSAEGRRGPLFTICKYFMLGFCSFIQKTFSRQYDLVFSRHFQGCISIVYTFYYFSSSVISLSTSSVVSLGT
jgi:hypothetical protein